MIRSLVASFLLLLTSTGILHAADRDRLLFHAETFDWQVLSTQGADVLFNPASVVKVGTSLWALERLGPEHRYFTAFGVAGNWDRQSGLVDGSLIIKGGGDPDFQTENLFLVARDLNRLGLSKVKGRLRISGTFWIGWENGVAHRVNKPREKLNLMGGRVRAALNPDLWDRSTQAAWEGCCKRRGWDPEHPPRVEILGNVRSGEPSTWTPLVVHQSNPLVDLLKRFNVYSNNDIVRVAEGLGGPAALERYLELRLGAAAAEVELETSSGEKQNRMTARVVIRLLRAFHETLASLELQPGDVLPLVGCDPGSTGRKFPALSSPSRTGTVVVKTGTLTNTDGGVAVLSGFFDVPGGEEVLFCIAAPNSGKREMHWRAIQQSWLLDLIKTAGGAIQWPCGPELPFSDTHAVVVRLLP